VLYSGAISAGGFTNAVYNSKTYKYISIYGTASDAGDLTIQLSDDGQTYYSTQYAYTIVTPGDFGFSVCVPFAWLRILSSANQTSLVVKAVFST
jgi:pectin methylesterase-like acyl-CoA thioesterase